jgi:hypothetical protein
MACYTLHLAQGSTLVSRGIKAATITKYLQAVDQLAAARNLMSPQLGIDGRRNAYITDILRECKRWEQMPNRREPVTNEMMAYIVKCATRDTQRDSRLNAVTDWLIMGEYGGFRKGEWAQDKDDVRKGRYAKNVDGSPKAFLMADFEFRKNKQRIAVAHDTVLTENDVDQIYLTWRFQKNLNNGESLPFSRNDKTPGRCFVRSALRARDRAQRLGVSATTPMAVYRDTDGTVKHISDKDVEHILRAAAKKVHNVTVAKDLIRWSCHSIRVGACIRLQLLNKPSHFIQMRLRWTSDAWRLYLRNLPELAHAQNEVIDALAEELAQA